MRRYRDFAIGTKLMLVMMLTACAAVLLAGTTRIVYEVATFRKTAVQDLAIQARIIGDNCAAALEFDNARTAQETLATLSARTDIVAACVYRHDGTILASYRSGTTAPSATFPRPEAESQRVEHGDLRLFRRVTRKGEVLGTIYLRSNLQPHYARLTASVMIALGSMLVSSILALALAARLQRIISDPIVGLATLVDGVRHRQDYSLRATKHGDDELGKLADGFNRMLEDIQDRDTERKRTEADLRQLSARLLQAQDEERRRVAVELHENTAQNLAAVSMYLARAEQAAGTLDTQAVKNLADALALTKECLREVRTLSYVLHPPMLDDQGLEPALRWFVEGFTQRSGIQVDLEVSEDLQRLPQAVETALFRIVQESLTNAHRHAVMLRIWP